MGLRRVAAGGAVLLVLAVAGCAAPYDERMAFLDEIAQKGIDYRIKLYEQDTEPAVEACKIGFDLLDPDLPHDYDTGVSPEWRAQVEEAYVKSCMTGELKPKPDVDGIDAVTAVPVTAPPASPTSTPSPTVSPAP
ncbi:hypothetical protein [Polymorphospora sp. NPDC050346]|uniref:hypothetical protein n=1 Tax=Polymorphospora sp. NPDC050346 TaxID=3155780 RepID=UPI0033CAF295